jgi:UDP-N-acetylmuramoyl-L-alanyl-D-glutamate--2,6-diaminopimelate ligase
LALTLTSFVDALRDISVGQIPDGELTITGASSDSRTVQPGWLFCAIPGARADGAAYVRDAISRGAVAIVTEAALACPGGTPVLRVSDAYAAAGRIAEVLSGRPGECLRLIGITGTNGKTTCAYLLRDVFSRMGHKTGMIGTVEYDLGGSVSKADRTTPPAFRFQELLREMVGNGVQTAVVEVSSHALAQRRMGTVRFAAGLFTNLTRDHLDYHHTFDDYYTAKRRLFGEYLAPNGVAAVNVDDPYGVRLAAELSPLDGVAVRTFGESPSADRRTCDLSITVDGCEFRLTGGSRTISFRSPMIGRYNASNIAGCATLALELGADEEALVDAIHGFEGAPGRLEPIRWQGISVFVDYAHTDDALANVLRALRGLAPRRVLVVFGCGGDRDRTKRPAMGRVAGELADRVFLTSDNPRGEDPEDILDDVEAGLPRGGEHRRIVDRGEAIAAALSAARAGDVVLVAGKGHEDYQEIGAERLHFSDVEVIRTVLGDLERKD